MVYMQHMTAWKFDQLSTTDVSRDKVGDLVGRNISFAHDDKCWNFDLREPRTTIISRYCFKSICKAHLLNLFQLTGQF